MAGLAVKWQLALAASLATSQNGREAAVVDHQGLSVEIRAKRLVAARDDPEARAL